MTATRQGEPLGPSKSVQRAKAPEPPSDATLGFSKPHGKARRRLRSADASSRIGLGIVVVIVVLSIVGPLIAPYDPLELVGPRLDGPSADYWMGTDRVGRDLFSRVLHGARLSLGTAVVATILISAVGLTIGCITGYIGGIVDSVAMRIIDVLLAFPGLILALVVAGMFTPSLIAVLGALATTWWITYARVIRSLVLSLREKQFIEAARAAGGGRIHIISRHVVPNVIGPLIVLVTLEVGSIILAVSALSFLGLGAQPPTPEWGAMLNDGRNFFLTAPHVMLVPGAAIGVSVLGFNLLGDGIRDVLDPRTDR